jgi:hypothetical protein
VPVGQRARHLGNRQRAIKLLDRLTLGYNHHADERAFAVAIRKYLEGHHGRPQLAQRKLDDLKRSPSLYTAGRARRRRGRLSTPRVATAST